MELQILQGADKETVQRFKGWDNTLFDEDYRVVGGMPGVGIGEVSWLKASLFGDDETFIPGTVMEVSRIIDEEHDGFAVIDDALIIAIKDAFAVENATTYDVGDVSVVVAFLEEHKGKECFLVSW